jgi:hypothetical protein
MKIDEANINHKENLIKRGFFQLREIYKRFFGAYPPKSHDSEADVNTLLKCACACYKEFVDVAMKTSYKFCDVKELK